MMELVQVMDEIEMLDVMFEMGLSAAYVDIEIFDDMVIVLMADGVEYVFSDIQAAFEYIVEQAEDWMWQ